MIFLFPLFVGVNNENVENKATLCPFLRFFHVPCFGCGLTKSIIYFYKGDLAESLRFHGLGVGFALFSFILIIVQLYDIYFKKEICERILNNSLLWKCIAALFLINYVVKIIVMY